jgi:hypothetical protein
VVKAAVVPTLLLALAWAGVWSRETGAERRSGNPDHRVASQGDQSAPFIPERQVDAS